MYKKLNRVQNVALNITRKNSITFLKLYMSIFLKSRRRMGGGGGEESSKRMSPKRGELIRLGNRLNLGISVLQVI